MISNYRVVHSVEGEEEIFALHEAYFDSKYHTRPRFISSDPLPIIGENLEELKTKLERMKEALEKPLLEKTDF
ncbi:hypothetical protein D4R99_04020 [bacterium]|nr:MAG: hypothetical protein D4R99_04020 [bacterium]